MKAMTMRYPGDPACEVLEMTRAEFLEACPRTPVQTWSEDGELIGSREMAPDEIRCDSCDEDPGPTVFLVKRSRAYCGKCFDATMRRHCS